MHEAILYNFRADINADGYISISELEDWIILKVKEHFEEAASENENTFKALDTDNDGAVFLII